MAPSAISEEVTNGAGAQETAKSKVNGANGHANGEDASNGHTSATGEAKSELPTSEPVTATSVDERSGEVEVKKETEEEEEEEEEDQSMKCAIKHLDRRYDDNDEQYYEERKNEVEKPKQKDWWRLYAFCVVRHFNSDGDHSYTRLYINPQPLRQLLKDVVGNYPTDPVNVDDVQIASPYHSLFHYYKELDEEGRKRFEDDEESLAQHGLLMEWIKTHFELDIAGYENCINGDVKAISYDQLWTIFPPGKIVHAKLLNQDRAFRVTSTYYDNGELPGLSIQVQFVDYDGEKLGTRKIDLFVPKYSGTRELSELEVMPLELKDDAEDLRTELVERGRKFESFIGGQHFLQYNGIAVKRTPQGYARFHVNGRVMVDVKTFHRLEANDNFNVKELPGDVSAKLHRARKRAAGNNDFVETERTFDRLSDEDASITNATARGYSFTVKRFLEFFVDKLSAIEWNEKCFDNLVLDASTKKTVQALVSTHSKDRETFDDIVKGKGQGLVCVLHGPPGVGKTLTAECVAEFVKRPLYMVGSGDLGVNSSDLDHNLTRIMDMTSTWRAVLLIDEADIFLERRSLHDLHRNAMVSVFLRVLEYYSGILFLTTNRVNTFDDAFKSRIHIPIRYTDLSVDSRIQIWRNFCKRVPGGVEIDEAGLETLAEHDLNGRQIKNVIKAAESLAAFDNAKLDLKQLQLVTKIQATFEKDLTNVSGIDYTAPGSSRKDADSRNMFL